VVPQLSGKVGTPKSQAQMKDAKLRDRQHRGAALHRIREQPEMRDDGYEWYVTCDAVGHEVEVVYFKAPAYEKNVDDEALRCRSGNHANRVETRRWSNGSRRLVL
jgi:hypothetical protein